MIYLLGGLALGILFGCWCLGRSAALSDNRKEGK